MHKVLKSFAPVASDRDNLRHIMRSRNTHMAALAMEDGLSWRAPAYDRKEQKWVTRVIKAGPGCLEALRSLSERMAYVRAHGVGRARGTAEWKVVLSMGERAVGAATGSWEGKLATKIRRMDLLVLYKEWYGRGRPNG